MATSSIADVASATDDAAATAAKVAKAAKVVDAALYRYPDGEAAPELVDIGANLTADDFRKDLPAVIERARRAGVGVLIATGASVRGTRHAAELASAYPGRVVFTAGVHPHDAKSWSTGQAAEIEALAALPACVAVGECGLDFNRDFSPRDAQEAAFGAQVALAVRLGKPLFMHCRDAGERFAAVLTAHAGGTPLRGVVHCFTGDGTELDTWLRLGLHIGITGWVCDERDGRGPALAELVRRIPPDRLLLETDAPYLVPRTIVPSKARPKRNEPALLPHVLAAVAQALGRPMAVVAAETTTNARALFDLR